MTAYYQIVKCFRDEDLRADHVSLNLPDRRRNLLHDRPQVREIMEALVRSLAATRKGVELGDFPIMTFAMKQNVAMALINQTCVTRWSWWTWQTRESR